MSRLRRRSRTESAPLPERPADIVIPRPTRRSRKAATQ
jgi:hypothetical protein